MKASIADSEESTELSQKKTRRFRVVLLLGVVIVIGLIAFLITKELTFLVKNPIPHLPSQQVFSSAKECMDQTHQPCIFSQCDYKCKQYYKGYVPVQLSDYYYREPWQAIDLISFQISLPPGWKYEEVQGIDSFVGRFHGDDIALSFDLGWYNGGISEDTPGYLVSSENIDIHTAFLYIPDELQATGSTCTDDTDCKNEGYCNTQHGKCFGYRRTGMFVDDLGHNNTLSIRSEKRLSPREQSLVLEIFRTIRFNDWENCSNDTAGYIFAYPADWSVWKKESPWDTAVPATCGEDVFQLYFFPEKSSESNESFVVLNTFSQENLWDGVTSFDEYIEKYKNVDGEVWQRVDVVYYKAPGVLFESADKFSFEVYYNERMYDFRFYNVDPVVRDALLRSIFFFPNKKNSCDSLKERIMMEVEEAHYCTRDEDCVIEWLTCPLPCYAFVNKKEVSSIQSQEALLETQGCTNCENSCASSPVSLKCRAGRCIE